MTGLTNVVFQCIQKSVNELLPYNTTHILSSESRHLVFLYWLRHYPSWYELSQLFHISQPTLRCEIKTLLPYYAYVLQNEIFLPKQDDLDVGFAGSQFLIDCSSHFRDRVHPGQELYYRGDKHAHFLTAQVTTTVTGFLIHLCVALGHNNDQGVFNNTMRKLVETLNLVGLADRGYTHQNLVTPNTQPKLSAVDPEEWSKRHAAHRSKVENLNSLIKNWGFAAYRVCQEPEVQALALLCVYGLTNMMIKSYPMFLRKQLY